MVFLRLHSSSLPFPWAFFFHILHADMLLISLLNIALDSSIVFLWFDVIQMPNIIIQHFFPDHISLCVCLTYVCVTLTCVCVSVCVLLWPLCVHALLTWVRHTLDLLSDCFCCNSFSALPQVSPHLSPSPHPPYACQQEPPLKGWWSNSRLRTDPS